MLAVFLLVLSASPWARGQAAMPTSGDVATWAAVLSTGIMQWTDQQCCFTSVEQSIGSAIPSNQNVDPTPLRDEITAAVSARFNKALLAVESVRNAARSAYDNRAGTNPETRGQCCRVNLDGKSFDWRFQGVVDNSTSCVRLPFGATAEDAEVKEFLDWSAGIDNAFRSVSLELGEVTYSYYGSLKNGEYAIYPATRSSDCGSYDPRRRPWWLQSLSVPRNVVMLLDPRADLNRLREIALDVLGSLTPDDWFMVRFTYSEPDGLPGCYADQLAQNNANNANLTESFLRLYKPKAGESVYNPALLRIPSAVANSANRSQYPTAVFLVGSGDSTDAASLNAGSVISSIPNATLFVIGVNVGTSDAGEKYQRMRQIALSAGGQFSVVNSDRDVGEALEQYRTFADYQRTDVIGTCSTTPPYFDASGLGLVLTIACPVHDASSNLLGVAGVDVPFLDILDDLAKLVNPLEVNELPNFVLIQDLENSNELFLNETLPSMLAGQSGSASGEYDRILSRGGREQGAETRRVSVTYRWGPIAGTDFKLCLVIPTNLLSKPKYGGQFSPFLYHRIDVSSQGVRTGFDSRRGSFRTNARNCFYVSCDNDRRADMSPSPHLLFEGEKDARQQFGGNECCQSNRCGCTCCPYYAAGFKLAPFAWSKRYEYLYRPIDAQNVSEIKLWAETQYSQSLPFSAQMTEAEIIHSHLQLVESTTFCWESKLTSARDVPVFRYIGTESGIFMSIPILPLPEQLDPTQRVWYKSAKLDAAAPKMHITPPYRDALINADLVTVSKALLDSTGEFFGVVGSDFRYGWLQDRYTDAVKCPGGIRCILVDRGGLVLVDTRNTGDLFKRNVQTDEIIPIFFGDRDENLAALANQMLQTGLLTKNYCNDFNALQRQSFYEITGVTTAQSGTTSSCNEQRQFVVTPVPGTAVFLLVVEELAAQEPCCQAACSASLDAKRCEAPCFVPLALRDACASFEVTTEDANLPSCPGRAAPIPPNTGTGLTTAQIVGISIGSVAGAFILGAGGFFGYQKIKHG